MPTEITKEAALQCCDKSHRDADDDIQIAGENIRILPR